MRRLLIMGLGGLAIAAAAPAAAQEWRPTRPVEIVVPFAAGGSTDLGMRVIAPALEARWGVPVRVVNKPGGNTVPAVNEVRNAAPDGHTMLADGPPSSSMLDTAVRNLPFRVQDRTFVSIAAYTPMKFVVPADSPFRTLQDAAEAARRDPGSFTWTSLGGAGAQDMANRQFFRAIGVDVMRTRPLQLRGGSEAITMTAGGHVRMGVGSYASITAPLQAGRLRVLAVASPERWPTLPDTPTAREAGFPTIETLYWIGFSGPPGLPAEIAAAYDRATREIVADAQVREGLLRVGLLPLYANQAQMLERVAREREETQQLWARQ